MAHELSFQKNVNGDFVTLNEKPWHGFGTILTTNPTVADALEYGGLGYHVEKSPNVHRMPSGVEIVSEKSFFTWRTDTNVVLGHHVGDRYTCIQNHDALSIVDEFPYHIETAGVLKDGQTAFIAMKSDRQIVVGGNDVTDMYLLFINTFDGTKPVTVLFTPIRVVCNNTLSMALKGATNKYTFRHTASATDKIKEAARVMGLLEKNVAKLQTTFEVMAETAISPLDFMGHVFLTSEEIAAMAMTETLREDSVLSTRKANIIRNALAYYSDGFGQAEWKGTGWGAFNAITGFMSHKQFDDRDDMMLSTVLGNQYENLSQRAADLVLEPKLITRIPGLEKKLFN